MNDVERYITYPMAIQVFKQDLQELKKFSLGNLYLDLVESIIKRMEQDFYKLKSELYSKNHIDVRRLNSKKYTINGKVIEYTSDELKEMTKQLMNEYLTGNKAETFIPTNRPWTN
ncbi:hypothetical protein [Ornithinibacillus contaminans]|uniref:hypothetical protein n=1 Tax=Ornithinibacillus contaminans TaxID=694055 RepID=UPI00064E0BA1|nr:hypothetical protein [Ornithinibacillus contaminans]